MILPLLALALSLCLPPPELQEGNRDNEKPLASLGLSRGMQTILSGIRVATGSLQ